MELGELANDQAEVLRSVAREGLLLRRQFDEWYSEALLSNQKLPYSPASASSAEEIFFDPQMHHALVLYHAVSLSLTILYRSPHYDYLGHDIPDLSDAMKLIHATKILELVEIALEKTNIAAFLFMWPVHLAALHGGTSSQHRARCVALFKEIERRGFLVVRRYAVLLQSGWLDQDFQRRDRCL